MFIPTPPYVAPVTDLVFLLDSHRSLRSETHMEFIVRLLIAGKIKAYRNGVSSVGSSNAEVNEAEDSS